MMLRLAAAPGEGRGRRLVSPGTRIELPAPSAVHVWHADLQPPDARWRELVATLTPDERERVARLRSEPHRRRFVTSRGLLRVILGAYLGSDPGEIRLTYGVAGKPRLAGTSTALAFSLAHSEDLAVYALAVDVEVGVDVERLRPVPDMLAIAACCFSAREQAFLVRLDDAKRLGAFFRAWTRKEAWLKATGCGLALAPRCVEVSTAVEQPARLLGLDGLAEVPWRCSVHDLRLRPGYAAALAVTGSIQQCLCRPWQW